MNFNQLLIELNKRSIKLKRNGETLGVRAAKESMDPEFVQQMRGFKDELLSLIDASTEEWWCPPRIITPEMLTLVKLTQEDIDRIVSSIPGGTANVQDIYPLAPLQEGILFHHLVSGQGDAYLQSSLYVFDSRERLDAFMGALQSVIARHDILRTSIFWENLPEPVQVVWQNAPLAVEDVRIPPDVPGIDYVQERFSPERYRLDLRRAPMLKACIAFDETEECWIFLLLVHHLVGDQTTLEVIKEEIEAHLEGHSHRLPPSVPYRNLVAQALLGVSRQEHEAFFKEMLGQISEPTAPFGILDIQGDGSAIQEAYLDVDEMSAKRIKDLARRNGISAACIFHQAWAHVLSILTDSQSVVFGTVLFGRMQGSEGANRGIGLFINTLPLRIDITGESIRDSVRRTHKALADLMVHEHAPLSLAQRCSAVQAPTPLFTSLLNYRHVVAQPDEEGCDYHEENENYEDEEEGDHYEEDRDEGEEGEDDNGEEHPGMFAIYGQERTNYPFTLSINDFGNSISIHGLIHRSIDPDRVLDLLDTAMVHILDAMEKAPETPANTLGILSKEERLLTVKEWNLSPTPAQTQNPAPCGLCMHEIFEQQAERTPDAIAVESHAGSITYAALNERANRLAHRLRALGVTPESRVAVCMEKSIDSVAALMGILKAGGAYVPLDPSYPTDRLRHMLSDSAPLALLTLGKLAERLELLAPARTLPVLDMDSAFEDYPASNIPVVETGVTARHLAYVIYTSGSTGLPKGVMIDHRGAVNTLLDIHERFQVEQNAKTLALSSFSFDLSVYDIFGILGRGGTLVIPSGGADPTQWADIIRKNGVTLWNSAPPLMQLFMDAAVQGHVEPFPSVTLVMLSGDWIPVKLPGHIRHFFPNAKIYSLGGATEASIWSVYYPIDKVNSAWKSIPYGRPLGNQTVYVLDKQGKPCPIEVSGELHIGGIGVAMGYQNRPELSAEKFIPDPFIGELLGAETEAPRMYKTGDLCRWREDGQLEILGRNDFQVKIRGYRIELGEIEARLAELAEVREAIVTAREDLPGQKRLVAYIVSNEEIPLETLKRHLAAALPDYMIPSAFVHLEALPLTQNGKLDRKALPAPEGALSAKEYTAPVGRTEELLAAIWSELLGVERVGRFDNFFELGGHSLLTVSLIERMRTAGLSADVRAIFASPTLEGLAKAAQGQNQSLVIPPNLIPGDCTHLTPEMLPLITLSQGEIETIAKATPGGMANIQDIYPLAPLQEGILFHHIATTVGDAYLVPNLLAFRSRELLDAFAEGMQKVVDRHDVLRTAILWEGLSEPVQVVRRRATLPVEEMVLDPERDGEEQLYERYDLRHYRLDVRQAPMLRLAIGYQRRAIGHQQADDTWLMLVLMHHLVGDHTTLKIIQEEIGAILSGEEALLPPSLPYRNLVAQARLGVSQEEHETFFRAMLGDVDEPTAPFGILDIQGDVNRIREARVALDQTITDRLKTQSKRVGVSTASLCHQAWAQVVSRLTGRQDVVFGTIMLGRMQAGEGAGQGIGLFINTLPIKITIAGEGTESSVRHTHQLIADLMRHEHATLTLAQRCSSLHSSMPLFTTLFNYRRSEDEAWEPEKQEDNLQENDESMAETEDAEAQDENEDENPLDGIEQVSSVDRSSYPVNMDVDDYGHTLTLTAQVVSPIEPERICAFMAQALTSLLHTLEQEPQKPVNTLEVLPEAERRLVMEEWNRSQGAFPDNVCVQQLIEAQAAASPDAVAALHDERQITYGQLNALANRVAHRIRALGVRPDDRIALCIDRSLEMLVGILGILKAGGAYVPMDPAYPKNRLRHMLGDSEPVALLTRGALAHEIFNDRDLLGDLPLLDLDQSFEDQPDSNPLPEDIGQRPDHLAYVIYTSGSTGLPKGVMIEHRSLCNQVTALKQTYSITPEDRILQFASFTFDMSVEEIFGALCAGAGLVLRTDAWLEGADTFWPLCEKYRVSSANLPPLYWQQLFFGLKREIPSCVRQIMIGGDAVSAEALNAWHRRESYTPKLFNAYGPTEATVNASILETSPDQASLQSIGRPVLNTTLYILDGSGQPVPAGIPGELHIGGIGVARGYMKRPELSAEKFVPDPFSPVQGARMYRTGDLSRWLSDGTVEFLGRNDYQVKVRGFRIELGEIEARLAEFPGIRETVVIAREDSPGNKRLVAYYVSRESLEADALRESLAAKLPEYMVPVAFVRLEAMPLTPNRKLDRKALPEPEGAAFAIRNFVAPVGEAEESLAGIWSELLGVNQVGRKDNFFELGGHSLLAVSLIERMRAKGMNADVRTIFAAKTLAELAALAGGGPITFQVPENLIFEGCARITPEMLPLVKLDQASIDSIASAVPGSHANIQDIYPLAPLQEGLLSHYLRHKEGDAYLPAIMFAFSERGTIEHFTRAMQKVVDRHDALRTGILWEGLPEPVQVVWRSAPLPLEEVALDPTLDAIEQLAERFSSDHYRLDIRQAPMMRFFVARDEREDRWLLLIPFHNMMGDHTTLDVIREEVDAILEGEEASLPRPAHFRDLVAQARLGENIDEQKAFFKSMLGDVTEPTAPFGILDIHSNGAHTQEGILPLSAALGERIRQQARRLSISPASLFHQAWAQVLARLTGQKDVVFGTVLFGRMHGLAGTERAIGLFINMLPIRLHTGKLGAEEGVLATGKLLAELMMHEHTSQALAEHCSAVEGGLPLFTSVLNYRHSQSSLHEWLEKDTDEDGDETNETDAPMGEVFVRERTSYPLGLSVDELEDGFVLEALARLPIDPLPICQMMRQSLESLTEALEKQPDAQLSSLDVLPDGHRHEILELAKGTETRQPDDRLVHRLFEAQAQTTPDAVAVTQGNTFLSYRELDERANRLARQLLHLGLRPEQRVGICVKRSPEMVVSILAVLKAGGAYVPLEGSMPVQRLHRMAQDSQVAAMLTRGGVPAGLLEGLSIPAVDASAAYNQHPAYAPDSDPDSAIPADAAAYVVYTSGSTGEPKGVTISHRALCNLATAQIEAFGLGSGCRVLQYAKLGFDACVAEVFTALCSGAALVLPPKETVLAGAGLDRFLSDESITHATLPPALISTLSGPGALRTLVSAGDMADGKAIQRLLKQGALKIFNAYGPTEAAVCATLHLCNEGDAINPPIGRPLINTSVYLLDEALRPVPKGAPGEIHIGGLGVSSGYLNATNETEKAFLANPFGKGRLFKTGDMGRLNEHGEIEFLGRRDRQLKIRGCRMEPGEIEARMLEYPGIRQVLVTTQVLAKADRPGEKRLTAYVVSSEADAVAGTPFDPACLKEHLAQTLPSPMIPECFVPMESLPLTPNGKLDPKALPLPDIHPSAYAAPEGEKELYLANLWTELLDLEKVGRFDNFFELGGHSLLAMRLLTRLQAEGKDITMEKLLAHPTVAELATRMSAN